MRAEKINCMNDQLVRQDELGVIEVSEDGSL